ncbi:MAG: EscU/YscU/HrcU family type III secretion system export apparatus switch protein [Clostridium sp.]|jgi:flagellar biosynthesis protein|uniref:EscU/YscU/HrcU family type III secretion system export apparatus switch protein n=1 Tax=Clostridium sp. TaxID=1506 RepID=UPI0025BD8D16|nr:EscU/YscU/HrcU family type III secretion system export apparatus switch protein [Clostridium sp.]MCH3965253.1 EscU/YscU/HrcU family type III secretion system export apparatus switch protein [Clostridium sp.]MCI1714473.1 EscU/YscU/HrcU family type III secretion system export apparatus switch protein [Clostridium sp.]MCI1798735.1 EscU/YscU/HrcU family type III secretion system export apparatus switch protein [Clostridium sp.]MCI1812534.1 EscU/YscU/HrcU family type III secretion system export a
MDGRKKVAALKYDVDYESPIVSAAGIGQIADNILKKAEESNVPIVYDKELANLLVNINIGDNIPFELYDAVAKVIAYVVDIDNSINPK